MSGAVLLPVYIFMACTGETTFSDVTKENLRSASQGISV
jgi:hypothetical protein